MGIESFLLIITSKCSSHVPHLMCCSTNPTSSKVLYIDAVLCMIDRRAITITTRNTIPPCSALRGGEVYDVLVLRIMYGIGNTDVDDERGYW